MKKSIKLLEEYFWAVGIALAVSGVILTFTEPVALFISGAIFLIIAVVIKAITKK